MFQFATPWLFLLLPLPLLYRLLIPKAPAKVSIALKFPLYDKFAPLLTRESTLGTRNLLPFVVAMMIWSLIIIAACGPQWLGKPIALPRKGRNIMMSIDLSGSMQIPDMMVNGKKANRLQAIKSIANQFIDSRHGDRLGLILFGSKAYLQTPLTYDRQTVKTMLQDSTIGLAGQQTAIADSIGLAIKRLKKYPKDSRILILLTDGADNRSSVSLTEAAKMAAKENIKIYTIGFGSDKLIIQGILGPRSVNPSAELDERTLKQIAKTTGGTYFRAKDTKSLAKVYQTINKLEPISADNTIFRPVMPLYPWPLGAALMLSFMIVGRRLTLPNLQHKRLAPQKGPTS